MKCYEHLILHQYCVEITTTDSDTVNAIITQVEQLVGGSIDVTHKGCTHILKKLRNKDLEVYLRIIGWLCRIGWEPYAVLGLVSAPSSGTGSATIQTCREHYFRKETQSPPTEG